MTKYFKQLIILWKNRKQQYEERHHRANLLGHYMQTMTDLGSRCNRDRNKYCSKRPVSRRKSVNNNSEFQQLVQNYLNS